jgi:hypothetical protein
MPKAAMESMKHVRGMSMVLGVWPSGTSLYSRTVAIMRVDKSDAYMAEYETALKEFGEFARKADSPILAPMEVEKTQIDGAAALQITTKVPKPPAAQQVPQYDKMMEAFFGPGKKLVAWATPVDERTVVLGYVDREHLQRTIRTIKQGKPGLAADPEVARTTALLPSGAPWVAVWSPRGTIDLVKRTINAFAPDGDKAGGKIPEFPATPPIGLALTTAPNELQGHLVVPAEIFKAIGQYAARVKPRGEGRGGKEGEKTCAVRGEVRLDGKSLPAPARIRFVAAAEADSRAFSVKDGKFEGRLKAGQYRVSFRAASVPEKYRAPATSGLTVEVKEGQNVFEFDLR